MTRKKSKLTAQGTFNWNVHTDRPTKPRGEELSNYPKFVEDFRGYYIYEHPIFKFSVFIPSSFKLIGSKIPTIVRARSLIQELDPPPTFREMILKSVPKTRSKPSSVLMPSSPSNMAPEREPDYSEYYEES